MIKNLQYEQLETKLISQKYDNGFTIADCDIYYTARYYN